LALVLAELVEGAGRRAAIAHAPSAAAPTPMRLSARREGGAVLLELTDAGGAHAEEDDASGLSGKVVRALTRQIGAVLETGRLPCGRLRTSLSLPKDPAQPARD